MSEYVKPRQFWFNFKIGPNESIIQNQLVYMIKNSKHDFHVIELEPTLQLMKEMGDVLKFYLEIKPFPDDGAKARLVLEKYRKFKESLK